MLVRDRLISALWLASEADRLLKLARETEAKETDWPEIKLISWLVRTLRLVSEADKFEAETESLTERALKLLSEADMEATTVLNELSADKLADVSAD